MKTHQYLSLPMIGLLVLLGLAPVSAEVSLRKITVARPAAEQNLGYPQSLASNGSYLVAGMALDDTRAPQAGAVAVFDGRTLRQLRLITAADGEAEDLFGYSVALSGNLLFVGAPQHQESANDSGVVYVFDVRTGRHLRKIVPADPAAGDQFGYALAADGKHLAVGAAQKNMGTGAAYVFPVSSGVQRFKLTLDIPKQGDLFGYGFAIYGNHLLVGAPGADLPGKSNAGSVSHFSLIDGTLLHTINGLATAADNQAGVAVALDARRIYVGLPGVDTGVSNVGAIDTFSLLTGNPISRLVGDQVEGGLGSSLAVRDHLLIAGEPGRAVLGQAAAGAFRVYDAATGNQTATCLNPLPVAQNQFGLGLLVDSGMVYATCPFDDEAAPNAGAIYRCGPYRTTLPASEVMTKFSVAPGAGSSTFAAMPTYCIGTQNDLLSLATLSGAAAGTTKSLWTDEPGLLSLVSRTGFAVGGLNPGEVLSDIASISLNRNDRAWFLATVRGGRVTANTDKVLCSWTQANGAGYFLREGDSINANVVKTLHVPRQARQSDITCPVVFARGPNGVVAENDTAIYQVGVGLLKLEGVDIPALGVSLGEIPPRVACGFNAALCSFAAMLQSSPQSNMAVFENDTVLARRGDGAGAGAGGPSFGTFLGETNANTFTVFRATLNPAAGVNASNNEGLWADTQGATELIVRKGEELPSVGAGIVIKRFLRFQILSFGDLVALVQLAGPGVTAANDLCLVHYYYDRLYFPAVPLLREGDPAPGCGAARIATLSRVASNAVNGDYTVLASLVVEAGGASAANNLALFRGDLSAVGAAGRIYRQPVLYLRKGARYERAGNEVITTLSTSDLNLEATGALSTGLGETINSGGQVAFSLGFADGHLGLFSGAP
jgi:hypothetical protein